MASPPLVPLDRMSRVHRAKAAAQEAKAYSQRFLEPDMGTSYPFNAAPARQASPLANEEPWLQASPSRYQSSPLPSLDNEMATPSPPLSYGNPFGRSGTPRTPPPPAAPQAQRRNNPFQSPAFFPSQGAAPQSQETGDPSMSDDDMKEDPTEPSV